MLVLTIQKPVSPGRDETLHGPLTNFKEWIEESPGQDYKDMLDYLAGNDGTGRIADRAQCPCYACDD